jgi:hypothetical protein
MKANTGLIGLLLIILLVISCHRREDIIGPEYVSAPSDFYIIKDSFEVNSSTVNFETSTDYFKAEFSSRVNWFITIKGLKSGAIKKISGLTDVLNAQNSIWNGGHDSFNFFQMNEKAAVELAILGSSIVLRDTIFIQRAKKYGSQGVAISDDVSIANFEGFEGIFGTAGKFNTAPWNYGIYFDAGEEIFRGIDSLDPQFQGRQAVTLHGKDLNHNFYVGGFKRILTTAEYNTIPYAADSVYVNIYLYGTGDPNSRINYSFDERDSGMGAHVDNVDDTYEYQFDMSHTGWKLFSVKYSQLSRATNLSFGGSGNGIREPHKLRNVAFNLISSPAGSEVKVTFDFPIITFGKPFNPNE